MIHKRLIIGLSFLSLLILSLLIKFDLKKSLAQVQQLMIFETFQNNAGFKFVKDGVNSSVIIGWSAQGDPAVSIGGNPLYATKGQYGQDGLFSYARNQSNQSSYSIFSLLAPNQNQSGSGWFQQTTDGGSNYNFIPIFAQTPTEQSARNQAATKEYVDNSVANVSGKIELKISKVYSTGSGFLGQKISLNPENPNLANQTCFLVKVAGGASCEINETSKRDGKSDWTLSANPAAGANQSFCSAVCIRK